MMNSSKLLAGALAVLTLIGVAPLSARSPEYALVRGPLAEGQARRAAAVAQCAASAAQQIPGAEATMQVIGFQFPNDRYLRVHAMISKVGRGPVALSCDVDTGGKVRRFQLGS